MTTADYCRYASESLPNRLSKGCLQLSTPLVLTEKGDNVTGWCLRVIMCYHMTFFLPILDRFREDHITPHNLRMFSFLLHAFDRQYVDLASLNQD